MKKLFFTMSLAFSFFASRAQWSPTVAPNPLTNTTQKIGVGTTSPDGQMEINTSSITTVPLNITRTDLGNNQAQPCTSPLPIFNVRKKVSNGAGGFNTTNYFTVGGNGFLGLGNYTPSYNLDLLHLNTYNHVGVNFGATAATGYGSRRVFIINRLDNAGFNPISVQGDQGIFFNDGQNVVTDNTSIDPCTNQAPKYYYNSTGGFVIAPNVDPIAASSKATGFRMDKDGNVGIGIINPSEKFEVAGNIRCTKLRVTTQWWDKVFEVNYKLMPLFELEQYIKANKHLPDMPTDAQVQQNGVDVGDATSLLLKKVEELTLYLIEQQKQIELLKKQLEEKKN
ncbi:MAG: hypothetical protein HYZ42_09150 [Bacteroidetes bacterium]|nr:hypothetical protein [Bacteroidota bacterium]